MRNSTLVLFGVLLAACCVAYALLETVDVNRPDVQLAGKEAARALSKQFRGKYHHRLTRIVRAKAQDLGDNDAEYRMDVIVGMTQCLRTENFDEIQDCEFQDNVSTYKKCDVLVKKDRNGNHKLATSGCILASRNEI